MVYIWSHGTPAPECMKIRYLSSAEKYASAFVPPKVSWRTLPRCLSPGTVSDSLGAFRVLGAWEYVTRDADAEISNSESTGRATFMFGMYGLFPLFKLHGRVDGLAVAQHLHIDDI